MNCRIQNVALLLVLVLATGLAYAQPGIKVTEIDSETGARTSTTFDPSSAVAAKAPTPGPNGTYKYWDGIASTDYYNSPSYVGAPPNPQIGAGPDDILTVVNRTIARYPNPNALGYTGAANPYTYLPTHKAWLDTWLGVTTMSTVCPTTPRNNNTCVLDSASIRYDQLQGRFVVVFTVTDVVARVSNWILIVSRFATLACSTTGGPSPFGNCPNTPDLFTPPIVQYVGGPSTGGVNAAMWVAYVVPINVIVPFTPGTTSLGGLTITGGSNITGTACNPGSASRPVIPDTGGFGPVCTNYFPTGARMGIDNDNIVLTAPVLDLSRSSTLATAQNPTPANYGPHAGTRVTTIPKMVVYNGATAAGFINIGDDTATGTLTGCTPGTAGSFFRTGFVNICGTINPRPAGPAGPNSVPDIYFEPDNLRGRALASGTAVIAPVGTPTGGVITPIDYLIGSRISDGFGTETAPFDFGRFFIQPIIFVCPGTAIYNAPSGVTFCGVGPLPGSGQATEAPILGPLNSGVSSLVNTSDPAPVGQGPATSVPAIAANNRLFVGDQRPQQVISREGLLYVARAAKTYDIQSNGMGTSTVIYDIIRQNVPTVTAITGVVTVNPAQMVLESQWFTGSNAPDPNGFGFYAPMYDTPANVVQSGSVSPINLFPWLEKLFVGMTASSPPNLNATFATNTPSLWDFRPGDDAYDTTAPYLDPYTGSVVTLVTVNPLTQTTGPMIPFGIRGGASTDPNDLSLWLYGAFGKKRQAGVIGPGQWGTSVANYDLSFPATDPYNNDNAYFVDVQPGAQFFTWIQIARNLGLAAAKNSNGPCTTPPGVPPVVPPPQGNNSGGTSPGAGLTCNNFGPLDNVTRAEMARWIVLAQMDEFQVSNYLCNTGGDPSGVPTGFTAATCPGSGANASSFADVNITATVPGAAPFTCPGSTLCALLPPGSTGTGLTVNPTLQRYIEVMYRRGYTKGCSLTFDGKRNFCPNSNVLRRELAVFLIRAKMNNVFPTSLSGTPGLPLYGDNFGLFLPGTSYFTDVLTSNDYFIYIQKMRELRITNGTDVAACTNAATGPFPCAVYGSGDTGAALLTRGQIATFIVRAFFQ